MKLLLVFLVGILIGFFATTEKRTPKNLEWWIIVVPSVLAINIFVELL